MAKRVVFNFADWRKSDCLSHLNNIFAFFAAYPFDHYLSAFRPFIFSLWLHVFVLWPGKKIR